MSHILVIAEAGVNHNGSFEMAKALCDAAKTAGADFVKFQTFKAEKLVSQSAQKATYQQENLPDSDSSQLSMLRKLELSDEEFLQLADYCREIGIGFMSTPFDLESVDLLKAIGQKYWKIPSGEITNWPLLKKIGGLAGKVILSTGMSTLEEVSEAVSVLETSGTKKSDITLLHCTTQYPAPMESVNLLAMLTLEKLHCGEIGYSDHTAGITIPIAAAALGATVIEKHFTLDRTLPGPDHKASLTPDELGAMIRAIRQTEQALGDCKKTVTESERANRLLARKSIFAARDIQEGEPFSEDNLTAMRPLEGGISPMEMPRILGTPAPKAFKKGQQVRL